MTGSASTSTVVRCRVNGHDTEMLVPVRLTVAQLLRDRLGLTGTKVSCEMQVCGVCTVLVDGNPVSSCATLACDLDGADVLTIEGLARRRDLHPVQEAFMAANALQCGYCTPGFIMMAVALLDAYPHAGPAEVREWMDGNLCRCTGYEPIETAVTVAASRMREGTTGDDR